jgi:ATP/ADP translocase/HEAT repeat protein
MVEIKRSAHSPLSVLMFVYFSLVTFSIYVVKPAKESLFLDYLTKKRLPYAFLLTAILMGLAVSLNSRLLRRVNRPLYIASSLAFFVVSGLVFWLFIRGSSPWQWTFLLLYSWGDILMVTAITHFWILVYDLFRPRETKRMVGFLVSGGLMGGIAGSLVAVYRPLHLRTESLVLVGPVLLALCIGIVLLVQKTSGLLTREEEKPVESKKDKVGFAQSLALLRKNRYLLLLSGLILSAIIVSNLVDFQFKSAAEIAFKDREVRTTFLATFYLVILIVSYLFTVLLTSRILKNFGMRIALLILPVLLLLGSFAVFFIPAAGMIYWAVVVKGTDKSLSHSLSQSIREVLYIPVPPDIKYKAKVFIDMFLNKFADGLAGLVLIAVSAFLDLSGRDMSLVRDVSLIIIVFIVIWAWFGLRVTQEYVTIVKDNLHIKWRDADKLITEKIDVDMTKAVFDTLQSRDRSSVLYAMNLFDLIKRENLTPELKSLISIKGDELRARSMDSLLDVTGETLLPEFDDSLGSEELDSQVREIMSLDVYQELIRKKIEKVTGEKSSRAEVSKMEAAKVIGMMEPGSLPTRELKKLLHDDSPEVVRYAAESAGRLKRREFVPLLLDHLSRPATQESAIRALRSYGDAIVGTLRDYLSDPQENIRARQSIPEILAKTGSQKAADIMIMELAKEETELETELIGALHRMRMNSPEIRFSASRVHLKAVSLIKKCYLLLLQIHDVRGDRKKEVLLRDLENTLSRTLKQVFELLGLVYPQEDIIKAYQNILVGTKKALDYSVELLDNILKRELKELLLPLIEDTTLEEKARISRKMIKVAEKTVVT